METCVTASVQGVLDESAPLHGIEFEGVRDRAQVFLNGQPVGVLERERHETALTFHVPEPGAVLTVLVENQGRVNYGEGSHDRKGLLGPQRTLYVPGPTLRGGGNDLTSWTCVPPFTCAPSTSATARTWARSRHSTVVRVTDDALLTQVRQLRERGVPPKQIAKALGLSPAVVAPLVRQVAELQQSHVDPADRVLVGCWVSPGWSAGLGLDEDWAVLDPTLADETVAGGLANVLIVRQERASRVTACGFLTDVYCLGVKNAVGPVSMSVGAVEEFRGRYFSAFDEPSVAVPLELAQAIVHGAVTYARGLGFEPHPDFAAAAPYLGTPAGPNPITFGRNGKPCYISGPYDKPHAVVDALEAAVGSGNYDRV